MTTYTRAALRQIVFSIGEKHAVPTWALLVQAEIESNWNNEAVSSVGALGLFQIKPDTAKEPGYGITPCLDPKDPWQATQFACEFLDAAHREHGTWGDAFLSYNVGIDGALDHASAKYESLSHALQELG